MAMDYRQGVLLAVLLVGVFAGCHATARKGGAPRQASQDEVEAMDWKHLSTDRLIDLISGSPIESEGTLVGGDTLQRYAQITLIERLREGGLDALTQSQRERLTALRWPLPDFQTHTSEALDWKQFAADRLIGFLSGSPELRAYAARELNNRLDAEGNDALTQPQHERLTRALRLELPDCRNDTDIPVLELAARHDPDFAARFFLKHWDLMGAYSDIAFQAIRRAGLRDEAWKVVEHHMQSLDEFEVCLAIEIAVKGGFEQAADAIYERTKAMRWLIRLEALRALDQLDDPRTNQALRAHFNDIERTSIGLRILGGPFAALRAKMTQSGLRGDLIEALVRRKVEGADDFLDRLALDRRQGHSTPRWLAGVGLAILDRQRGISVLRRLLESPHEDDQLTGVEIASHGLALDVKQKLEALAQESPFETVQKGAAQDLRMLDDQVTPEKEEPYF